MGQIYFPSCNFTKASPQAAKKLRAYLKEKMPVAGCCRLDKTPYPAGDTALYFCQACRETLEQKPGNQLIPQTCLCGWRNRRTSPGRTTAASPSTCRTAGGTAAPGNLRCRAGLSEKDGRGCHRDGGKPGEVGVLREFTLR